MTLSDLSPDDLAIVLKGARTISDDGIRDQYFAYVSDCLRDLTPEEAARFVREATTNGVMLFSERN